ARLTVKCAERPVETLTSPRQLPVGQPLIQKGSAETSEQLVHGQVRVLAGGLQEEVPMSDRRLRLQGEWLNAGGAIAARPPECLQAERLPSAFIPCFDARAAEALAQTGNSGRGARAGFIVFARGTQCPVACLRDESLAQFSTGFRPHAAQGVGLRD